ncbi:MAG: hypothetical protein NDI61_14620 [Bdellovibrionaceae bacterium]|nr:hypothetical protein [Pseudobdellovibrionaceae bacterium]
MRIVWLVIVLTLFMACGKPQKDAEAERTAFDAEDIGSEALKDKAFTVSVTDSKKALLLLKKAGEDLYISNGEIGKRNDVLVSDYDLLCEFESTNDSTYRKTQSAIRSGNSNFRVVSRGFGTSIVNGYTFDRISFHLSRTEDLTITCERIYLNGRQIRVEDVRGALKGTFDVLIRD